MYVHKPLSKIKTFSIGIKLESLGYALATEISGSVYKQNSLSKRSL